MYRYWITCVLLLSATVAVAVCWYADRQKLLGIIERQQPAISLYGEKHSLWSPSNYLTIDTETLEQQLASRVDTFEGDFVTSSQGMNSDRLRQPTQATLDAVTALLDETEDSTRIAASQLLALYLQAFAGLKNTDTKRLIIRAHFQFHGMPKVRNMLADPNVEVRRAVALVLGNTFLDQFTVWKMTEAFNTEIDPGVKLRLAWAYWRLTNDYYSRN